MYIRSLDVAETTRDLYKITLRKFFKWMQKPELVSWIKVNRLKNYNYKTESDIFTEKEVELLIQHCQSVQEQAMIAVLYDSAARIAEFTKLKIGDIIQGDETFIVVNGKTGTRKIPLNGSLLYLQQYLETHPNKDDRNAALWLSSWDKQYTRAGIHRVIKQIAKRSKIQKRVTAHIFRHSRLTELARENLNESVMRHFAGWSRSSQMPSIYIHIAGDNVLSALRKIEPKKQLIDSTTVEQQVQQRLAEEKQKMQEEILAQLIETLKDPQHKAIQDMLFEQNEQP